MSCIYIYFLSLYTMFQKISILKIKIYTRDLENAVHRSSLFCLFYSHGATIMFLFLCFFVLFCLKNYGQEKSLDHLE